MTNLMASRANLEGIVPATERIVRAGTAGFARRERREDGGRGDGREHASTRGREDARARGRGYAACTRAPTTPRSERDVSKLLRGLAAGYGAKKLGGGCFSTLLIFLLLWWLLGHFGIFR